MIPTPAMHTSEISSSAMYRTAQFRVAEKSVDKCRKAIQEFVAYVKANEPRTLLYISLENEKDVTQFVHLMAFADPHAMVEHGSSMANKDFITTIYPEIIGGVVVSDFYAVAIK